MVLNKFDNNTKNYIDTSLGKHLVMKVTFCFPASAAINFRLAMPPPPLGRMYKFGWPGNAKNRTFGHLFAKVVNWRVGSCLVARLRHTLLPIHYVGNHLLMGLRQFFNPTGFTVHSSPHERQELTCSEMSMAELRNH